MKHHALGFIYTKVGSNCLFDCYDDEMAKFRTHDEARRAQICWNACTDIPAEVLERVQPGQVEAALIGGKA
jgi:hypothetical protein